MAKRLIDEKALIEHIKDLPTWLPDEGSYYMESMKYPQGMFDPDDNISSIENAPTMDAVEYDVLRKWLHEIAINNVNVPITMDKACEIIVERFDGLRKFARENGERRTDGNL